MGRVPDAVPDPAGRGLRELTAVRDAIDLAARHLLGDIPWDRRLDDALAVFCRVARADRAMLVETREQTSAPGRMRRAWPSLPASGSREADVASLDALLRSGIGGASTGHPFRVERHTADPDIAPILRREGIHGVLALPLMGGSGWQGYVRIDRCTSGGWEDQEVRSLVAASRLLGWAIDGWLSEVRLRAEVQGYRELIEGSPAITYAHTEAEPKRFVFMSPQIEEILGYPPEAWLREEGFAWNLLHPEDRRRIEAVDALGAPPVLEYRMLARDGREVWWCDASAPHRDERGQGIHVGVLLDVTSLRTTDRAVREEGGSSMAAAALRSAMLTPPSRKPRSHAVGLASAASRYMREHLGERVDRSTLARVLAVSPDYLGRLFKAEVGTSPHRFLIDLRMQAARRLLRETDLTVTQIASRVGFTSPSHFVTTFRDKTGITPAQFRRRVQ